MDERVLKPKQHPQKHVAVFGLGRIPEQSVPEIKIQYSKTNSPYLGKISGSKDVADFLRKVYPVDSIELQERGIVLYLDRVNEMLGYYKHTVGVSTVC